MGIDSPSPNDEPTAAGRTVDEETPANQITKDSNPRDTVEGFLQKLPTTKDEKNFADLVSFFRDPAYAKRYVERTIRDGKVDDLFTAQAVRRVIDKEKNQTLDIVSDLREIIEVCENRIKLIQSRYEEEIKELTEKIDLFKTIAPSLIDETTLLLDEQKRLLEEDRELMNLSDLKKQAEEYINDLTTEENPTQETVATTEDIATQDIPTTEKNPLEGVYGQVLPDGGRLQKNGLLSNAGSTSKVFEGKYIEPNGTPHNAVIKYMVRRGTEPNKGGVAITSPQQLVADAQILALDIPGLPKLYSSGWDQSFKGIAQDITSSSYLSGGSFCIVMEPIDTSRTDIYKSELKAFSQENVGSNVEIEQTEAEAMILSKIAFYIHIAAELTKNGWSVPTHDFSLDRSDAIYYTSDHNFKALDLGMAEPVTQESVAGVIQRIGGIDTLDGLSAKFGQDGDHSALRERSATGLTLEAYNAWANQQDQRTEITLQFLRLVKSFIGYQGATSEQSIKKDNKSSLDSATEILQSSNNDGVVKMTNALQEIFSDASAANGWVGLKKAFLQFLGRETLSISTDVKERVKQILKNTGLTELAS